MVLQKQGERERERETDREREREREREVWGKIEGSISRRESALNHVLEFSRKLSHPNYIRTGNKHSE